MDSLVDVENKYTMNIRTVVRIMLDDPGKNVILDAKPLIDSFMDWIREKQMEQRINPGFDPIALVFIYACIVFGDELFGPYLRKIMKIQPTLTSDDGQRYSKLSSPVCMSPLSHTIRLARKS